MKKPLLLAVVVAVATAVAAKRRQAQHDTAALWREATSDASR
ncbi:MAG TPA: DLW-39 family protein [Jatrophihabitans sp.]|nr:DLW-39 family protein [Jatrophihabitans sp.]